MMGIKEWKKTGQAIGRAALQVPALIAVLFLFTSPASAEDLVEARIIGEPELPRAVQSELGDIFRDTLANVLFEGEESDGLLGMDAGEVAEAIRTGTNIVIEPKGYSVARLELDLGTMPVQADFLVRPVGWTPDDPHAVLEVRVQLAEDWLPQFWLERLSWRLNENAGALEAAYAEALRGLPTEAADAEWALGLVMPGLRETDPAVELFSGFEVGHTVELGRTAVVTLSLSPKGEVVELIRTRMYSRTLYNFILDRFRERLLAEADFLEGMPQSEVEEAAEEISERLEEALVAGALARQLRAWASVDVAVLTDEPVVRIDARVESDSYDLSFETFVDFGNESRDSSEVQTRFGFLLTSGIELFLNLNYFTNDSTLETDIALGLHPSREIFIAVGYELERKAPKYFFECDLAPGLQVRGEVFEEDELNEFGLSYQLQQYFSAAVFTNGNNEFWLRAIFRL